MSLSRQDFVTRPFSIRLTAWEKAELERQAAGPLGPYIRGRLGFGPEVGSTATKPPAKQESGLGQILAKLGESGISLSLSQLARQAEAGDFVLDDRTRARLHQACDHIRDMRLLLLEALGKQIMGQLETMPRNGVTELFNQTRDGDWEGR